MRITVNQFENGEWIEGHVLDESEIIGKYQRGRG